MCTKNANKNIPKVHTNTFNIFRQYSYIVHVYELDVHII